MNSSDPQSTVGPILVTAACSALGVGATLVGVQSLVAGIIIISLTALSVLGYVVLVLRQKVPSQKLPSLRIDNVIPWLIAVARSRSTRITLVTLGAVGFALVIVKDVWWGFLPEGPTLIMSLIFVMSGGGLNNFDRWMSARTRGELYYPDESLTKLIFRDRHKS